MTEFPVGLVTITALRQNVNISIYILNLGVCNLLRPINQVQEFPSNATLFNSCLLFYSNYPLHVSVVRSSEISDVFISG
jgi:hypothetical protein